MQREVHHRYCKWIHNLQSSVRQQFKINDTMPYPIFVSNKPDIQYHNDASTMCPRLMLYTVKLLVVQKLKMIHKFLLTFTRALMWVYFYFTTSILLYIRLLQCNSHIARSTKKGQPGAQSIPTKRGFKEVCFVTKILLIKPLFANLNQTKKILIYHVIEN